MRCRAPWPFRGRRDECRHDGATGTALAESRASDHPIRNQPKEFVMNKDQVQGRATEAKGNIKEAAGKVVGNQKLQGEGLVDQAKGKTQAGYGDAKEQVKKGIDRM
jgi:uncharacterized protein YjbJ (UPF0337 family)